MDDATAVVTWDWAADGVARLTLNHPPMNLLSRPVLAALTDCLRTLAAISGLRALVVTSASPRAFSAGADIKEFPAFIAAAPTGGVAHPGQAALDELAALPVPTIAAVEGPALGGGCELALACDLRVAGPAARFGLPETGLGIFPCYGGTQRLPRLIGPAAAKDLIFTGRQIDADEALRIGLVNRVVLAGQTAAEALALAQTIAGRAGQAVRAAKRAIDAGLALDPAAGSALEAALADAVFQTRDAQEGVAAFLAKRPPVFRHE